MIVGWFIVAVMALGSLFLFTSVLRGAKADERLEERLSDNGETVSAAASAPAQVTAQEPLSPALMKIAEFGEKLVGNDSSREKTERLLAQAGYSRPGSTGVFLAVKTFCGVAVALLLFLLTDERSIGTLALALIGWFIGGTLPELLLKAAAARRYVAIERSMPDALDLMVICAEAGLPFNRIFKVVSRELALSAPELAHEMAVTNAELEIMPERAAALRSLARRTQVPSVESMVSTLIQGEQFGTPLAQALHNIASESRSTLILTLEERAGKLPARLSIPLMTLILPSVVAIVAAPALMRVIRTLMQ